MNYEFKPDRGLFVYLTADHFLGASDLGSEGIWRWEGGHTKHTNIQKLGTWTAK